jgi:hypothetical protein
LANRINAAGWRVGGSFPSGVFADAVDLSSCSINGLVFTNCSLNKSLWRGANVQNCNIGSTSLQGADFLGANIYNCLFYEASLDESNFVGTDLISNVFIGGSIEGAQFEHVELGTRAVYSILSGPSSGRAQGAPKNQFLVVRGANSIKSLALDAEVVTDPEDGVDPAQPKKGTRRAPKDKQKRKSVGDAP